MSRTFSCLDLSTAHLPPRLREELNAEDGVVADNHTYGWWMWVPSNPRTYFSVAETPPEEILAVQIFARAQDCDWVRFDVDGEIDPDLRTFADED